MPHSIAYTLDRYIKSHAGIFNRFLKSKGMVLVKIFTLPYIAVADSAYAFVIK